MENEKNPETINEEEATSVEETIKEEPVAEEQEITESIEEELPKQIAEFEKKRATFMQLYKKQKRINSAIVIPALFLVIIIFVVLYKQFFIAVAINAVVMIAVYIYSRSVKKASDERVQNYIKDFYTLTNDYAYENSPYVLTNIEPFEKLNDGEFTESGFLMGITNVGSRNTVKGTLDGKPFKVTDCIAKIIYKGKQDVCFLGKLFTFTLDESTEYKTLLYIPSKEVQGAGPNATEGLDEKKELGNSHLRVWSNDPHVASMLTKKVYEALADFEPNEILVDIAISIKEDKIYVALSYENDMMVLPIEQKYNTKLADQYASDLRKVAVLVQALTKKKGNKN